MFWPPLVRDCAEWGLENRAQYSLLAAHTPFAILGLRYTLKMLSVILYEFTWKAFWFIFVVAPLYTADRMTNLVWSNAFACGIAIVLTPIIMPWRYFWQNYVRDKGDRWR
jgi:hypothetical protein